jgi:SAM-dependent methyltransferase
MTKVDLGEMRKLLQGKALTPNLRKYLTRNSLKRKLIENFISELLLYVTSLKPRTLVDVGCGEGVISHYVNKRNPRATLIGVDVSSQALSIARELTRGSANLILADACHLPLRRADTVMAVELLEHLPNPKVAVDEMARVADHMLITVPHTALFRLVNLLSLKNVRNLGDDPDHKGAYNQKKLKGLLASLEVLTLKKVGVWLLALARVREGV